MTTPDGQGLNWKWLSGLMILIVGGLISICCALALQLRSSDTGKLCALESDVKQMRVEVTEIRADQKWLMSLMQQQGGKK